MAVHQGGKIPECQLKILLRVTNFAGMSVESTPPRDKIRRNVMLFRVPSGGQYHLNEVSASP